MTRCLARTEGDEMVCRACGLRWDMNDPEPPVCGKERRPDPTHRVDAVAFAIKGFVSGLPENIR